MSLPTPSSRNSTQSLPPASSITTALTKDNLSPLHYAVRSSNLAIVRALLDSGVPADVNKTGTCTPLHMAAEHGKLEIARALLDAGADVNAQHTTGYTALHWAATGGYIELTELLVERGADVSAVEKNGWTALHLACDKGKEGVVRVFLGAWAGGGGLGQQAQEQELKLKKQEEGQIQQPQMVEKTPEVIRPAEPGRRVVEPVKMQDPVPNVGGGNLYE